MRKKISDELKREVIAKSLDNGLMYCYLSGERIEGDDYEIDHVIPVSNGGSDTVDNLRIVKPEYNRRKSDMSLSEYREMFRIDRFLNSKPIIKLEDVLKFKKITNSQIYAEIDTDDKIHITGAIERTYDLLTCPVTNAKYFYANLPLSVVSNDSGGLQPRSIDKKKAMKLTMNMKDRPQLLPSIARLKLCNSELDRILLFDGQHKVVANLLNNRTSVDLKIYVDGSTNNELYDMLMVTNLEAHTTFKQTPFVSNVLLSKMNQVMQEHMQEYMALELAEYTEEGFVNWLVSNKTYNSREAKNLFKKSMLDMMVDALGIDEKLNVTHNVRTRFVTQLVGGKLLSPIFKLDNEDRAVIISNLKLIGDLINKHHNDAKPMARGPISYLSLLVKDLLIYMNKIIESSVRDKVLSIPISNTIKDRLSTYVKRYFNHPLWNDGTLTGVNAANATSNFFKSKGLTLEYIINN